MRIYEASIAYSIVQLGDVPTLTTPDKIAEYLRDGYAKNPCQESLWVVCLRPEEQTHQPHDGHIGDAHVRARASARGVQDRDSGSYDDFSRKVFVRVFSDRVEVSSPGYPPQPLTLAKLRRGGYRPCSRNPLIAQTLATLGVMEQRGSGFARMRDAMLNHGLDEAKINQEDGFFVVTLPGPAGNYDRLNVPTGVSGPITPAIEAQLNDRQRKMVGLLAAGEELTSRRCEKEFDVSRPVTAKDFGTLVRLGLAEKVGSGRSTRYRAAIVK